MDEQDKYHAEEKYHAILPTHNDNISHKSPVGEFLTLTIGLFVVLGCIWLVLGFVVDYAAGWISPQREYAIFSHLRHAPEKGSAAQQELQGLVDKLKECAGIDIPLQVRLQQSREPNAFALPGGVIGVNSALLSKVKTENGLAFVLGHELGHFLHRDHLRGMGRGLVLMGLSSFFTGSNSGLTRLVTPAMQLGMARYSQEQEARADATGVAVLKCRYGHGGGATEFFQALGNHGSVVAGWFSSHPQTQARIFALQKQVAGEERQELRPLPATLQELHDNPDYEEE